MYLEQQMNLRDGLTFYQQVPIFSPVFGNYDNLIGCLWCESFFITTLCLPLSLPTWSLPLFIRRGNTGVVSGVKIQKNAIIFFTGMITLIKLLLLQYQLQSNLILAHTLSMACLRSLIYC